jgi:hypothetical protein
MSRGNRQFRAVTHYWISDEDIGKTLEAMQQVVSKI